LSTTPRTTLYLDIDGVLLYAKDDQWVPRPDASEFLSWATEHFACRWLTNWIDPNRTLPLQLGITVPAGIIEVQWRKPGSPYPFKAAGIDYAETWNWLEDQPAEADLDELRRRGQRNRLIIVPPDKPWILMSQIRDLLEQRLRGG